MAKCGLLAHLVTQSGTRLCPQCVFMCFHLLLLFYAHVTAINDSPPKIVRQSERDVWFHVPSGGAEAKQFMLRCDANGVPEVEYKWFKNDNPFEVNEESVTWYRKGQSGTLIFTSPTYSDIGQYQCHAINFLGVAVSEVFDVKLGVLEHFSANQEIQTVQAREYEPLSLSCSPPYGNPRPSVLWVIRNTRQSFVIETIKKEHITVDAEGTLRFSYVSQFDGRSDILYQCHATSPVLQGETRAGDERKLAIIKTEPSYRPPELMWGSPDRINVTAGKRLELTCIFSGYPLPKVSWYKENGEIPMARMKHDNFGKTIVIDPVHPNDEGTFVCAVKANPAFEKRHRMTVAVTAAPYWKDGPPKNLVHLEDEEALLKCNAAGDPQPSIIWYKNGGSLLNETSQADSRYSVQEDGRVLSIKLLNHDIDTAVYQCNASNPFGYIFANAYLHVRAHAPSFETRRRQTLKKVRGETVFLDCEVRAAPAPRVRWLGEDSRPLAFNERIKLYEENYTLQISDLVFDDSGVYRCNVSNRYGTNQAYRNLTVYKATRLLKSLLVGSGKPDETPTKVVEAHDSVDLSCAALSDNRLKIIYKWLHNGEIMDIDEFEEKRKLLKPNNLQLDDVRGADSGTYTCVAETDVDYVDTKMNLIVRDVPNAPIVVSIHCNERRAKVTWNAPFDNADPITEYVLEFRTGFEPDWWRQAVVEKEVNKTKGFEAVMTLSPWVEYTFRVIAINSHGRSPPGMKQYNCTTPTSAPYTNPNVTVVQGTEPDNLAIFWQPMKKELWNAPGFKYLIRYRLNDSVGDLNEYFEEDPQRQETVVRDQPTFKPYVVQVIACNEVGCSLEKHKYWYGYSGEAEPEIAPARFRIVDTINSTAVEFSWQHVPPERVLGHFQGYKIRVWELVRRRQLRSVPGNRRMVRWRRALTQMEDVIVPREANSAIVNNFKPMKHYMARVLAFNVKYEGPLSQPVKFEMPEGRPSPVTDLKVTPVGATSIYVKWKPPEKPNGILRGYHILFHDTTGMDENTKVLTPDTPRFFVPPKIQHYLFTEANALSTYQVTVLAETAGGMGEPNSLNVETWPIREPDKPGMAIEILNAKSAKVSWIIPETGMSGVGFFVNYSVAGENEWRQTEFVQLPQKHWVLTGLRHDDEYEVHLVARDVIARVGDFDTPSDKQILRIANAFNSTMWAEMRPKGESHPESQLTAAAWFIAVMCGLALAFVASIVICICTRTKGGKYAVKKKEVERGHDLDIDEERSFLEYQYGSSEQKTPEEAT